MHFELLVCPRKTKHNAKPCVNKSQAQSTELEWNKSSILYLKFRLTGLRGTNLIFNSYRNMPFFKFIDMATMLIHSWKVLEPCEPQIMQSRRESYILCMLHEVSWVQNISVFKHMVCMWQAFSCEGLVKVVWSQKQTAQFVTICSQHTVNHIST